MDKTGRVFLTFVLAITIVGAIIWLFYTIYLKVRVGKTIKIGEKIGIPIINRHLMKLVNWRDYHGLEYRIIKVSDNQFKLLINFDWNNFKNLLEAMQRDRLQKWQQERAQEKMKLSEFDKIAIEMDKGLTDPDIYKDPEELKQLTEIADKSEQLFGINPKIPATSFDMPKIDPKTYYDIYRLLDLVRLNMDASSMIDIELKDRKMSLGIPLILIKSNEYTHLRFDPTEIINHHFQSEFAQNLDKIEPMELLVFPDHLRIFPQSKSDNVLSIIF